jgi:hypothetical protein
MMFSFARGSTLLESKLLPLIVRCIARRASLSVGGYLPGLHPLLSAGGSGL